MPNDLTTDNADDHGRHILVSLLSSAQVKSAIRLADALLEEFGSLARTLGAGAAAQQRVLGDKPEALRCLSLVREAMLHALVTDLSSAPVLNNTEAVASYLHVAMAYELREQVRVLFLDVSHQLIRDEVLNHGSVSAAPFYPREVMRRALELGASGLLLVHNHPSGSLQPSKDDILMTRQLQEAGRALQVSVHDHIIVSRCGHISLRALGHI